MPSMQGKCTRIFENNFAEEKKTVTMICIQGWKEEWDGYQGVYKAGGRQDALWALGQFGDGLRKKT